MTSRNLDRAREWAESVIAIPGGERETAAAKIIQSLPDQWADVEKIWDVVRKMDMDLSEGTFEDQTWERGYEDCINEWKRQLAALLAPKRPTLADMTPEEQAECVGMWCDGPNGRSVIYCRPNGYFNKYADVTNPNSRNHSDSKRFDQLTPRFDLPRAWNPDGTPVEMDIETDRVEYGRVEGGGIERVRFPDGTKVRRLVGEWEETNE